MIIAEGLTKRLGRVMAVQSVSLSIHDGERVAIFGANGAGKTTLLRLLAGLSRPTAGTVTIDGRKPRDRRASLGFLGHDPYLYGHLTVSENLRFFADLYGVRRSTAKRSLDLIAMRHKADSLVNELSRGESRRVALARALLHDPSFLFLDEPFSNLDRETADMVQSLIQAPGRTVLLVTHDRRRGAAIGDRCILLESGRLAPKGHEAGCEAGLEEPSE